MKYLKKEIKEFKKEIKDSSIEIEDYYTLIIYYEYYEYEEYITYVFFEEKYTGGAHPNHMIYSVCYDKSTDKIISIENLQNKNDKILNILSQESREILKNNERIISYSMMYEGTKPSAENFRNFAFTSTGLKIFFERYQVAPYSEGDFQVTIPYDTLNL